MVSNNASIAPRESVEKSERVVSIDALRGFDMLMIVAADRIVAGLGKASDGPVAKWLVGQFTHSPWEGFTFYDFIFPLFIFLMGTSLVYSLDKAVERGGRAAIKRVGWRSVFLFLWGVFYNGGLTRGWEKVRWMGVLQRIAIAYFGGALIYLACGRKPWRIALTAALLLAGYAAILAWIPAPGVEAVSLAPGKNIVNYVDQRFLPGRLHDYYGDPEGLLSSIPAVASCLLGVLAGLWLKNPRVAPLRKAAGLVVAGLLLLWAGYAWSWQLSIIKKLWTSSYVLVATGWSSLLLGLFYLALDIGRWKRLAAPLEWVGANALFIYLVAEVVNFPRLAERLVGPDVTRAVAPWGDFLVGWVALALVLILARFLYRRQIFLRV